MKWGVGQEQTSLTYTTNSLLPIRPIWPAYQQNCKRRGHLLYLQQRRSASRTGSEWQNTRSVWQEAGQRLGYQPFMAGQSERLVTIKQKKKGM
ncbi:hypothetical protein BHC57_04230 [Snodgrassella alvi]|uniref:Uncharacterized protein n=1 Tax=Snodgrassella alvi TaxID=1196083 RepID=A0A855FMJ0_9NEIS|nr:hypothetical protein BHC51_10160 [Snodgrassella alvi]PIT60330.1 hypothetical protein BHC57_04230 [Snodgrassella alvi]